MVCIGLCNVINHGINEGNRQIRSHAGKFRSLMFGAAAGIVLIMPTLLLPMPAQAEGTRITFMTQQGKEWMDVALATTPQQRATGLMKITHLPPHHGMLFVYEGAVQPGAAGYWMFHTLIPLDIAFIGQNSRIIKTFTMPPCLAADPSHCPIYRPAKPYIGALEMPGGYFAKHHIQSGDTLETGHNLLD